MRPWLIGVTVLLGLADLDVGSAGAVPLLFGTSFRNGVNVANLATGAQALIPTDQSLSQVGMALAPDGHIFVIEFLKTNFAGIWRLNPATGVQTPLTTVGQNFLRSPSRMAVAPSGELYVMDGLCCGFQGGIIRFDPLTGAQTVVTQGGNFNFARLSDIAIAPSGVLYVTDLGPCCGNTMGTVIRVNPTSGTQTVVTTGGILRQPQGIAVAGSGELFVADAQGYHGAGEVGQVVRVNPTTGDQTLVASGANLLYPTAIAIQPGGHLFVADTDCCQVPGIPGSGGGVIRVNPTTGAQTGIVSVYGAPLAFVEARPGIVTGAGPGGGPHVRLFDALMGVELFSFFAYDPSFTGGVRVAVGDVNGDGTPDVITGAGPGGGPHVRVFDGAALLQGQLVLLADFFAYDPGFAGGVVVAAGDVNGTGHADIVTGAGPGGGPHVRVFDGSAGSEIMSFFAYAPAFTGGVFVAAADVNGDGHADIATGAGPGGGPHVRVFSGATGAEIFSFFAYDPVFTGGVRVALGDVSGDGVPDLITGAGPGGGPHVQLFDGAAALQGTVVRLLSFFAYDPGFTGGVFVGAADLAGDGRMEILTGAGSGGGPHLRAFDGLTGVPIGNPSASFFAYGAGFTGGLFVAGFH